MVRASNNDTRSIRAGSATTFLVHQLEDPAEERDGVKNEIARQGAYSGTLEDENGGDHQDGRASQHEHEDKGSGKDNCDSANMSNPQRSITSPIAGRSSRLRVKGRKAERKWGRKYVTMEMIKTMMTFNMKE